MNTLDEFKERSLLFSKALSTVDFRKFEKTGELFVHRSRGKKSSPPSGSKPSSA